jgi:TonB family protein
MHDRIESLAGAIALGEATDEERREYREHISSCPRCLGALGGEHEIERVASTVGQARDAEVWKPGIRDVVGARMRRRSRTLRWSASFFGVALAASFGIHALLAAGVPHVAVIPAAKTTSANDSDVMRVWVDRPMTTAPAPVAVAPPQRLIVTHNVIQIARAPLAASVANAAAPAAPKDQSKPRDLIAMTVHPSRAEHGAGKIPVWRRNDTAWRTVATTTTTSVTETAPQTFTHSAESLQVTQPITREVSPLGGETAINPQPPMIAYAEGAEGTTVFEVMVDERGVPTKCVVTNSSGYPVLDDAVCKAAKRAHYTPKMVDGRAVPGVYHDAFTFHTSDDSGEGIPTSVPSSIRPGGGRF